jgi:hypothetical protein
LAPAAAEADHHSQGYEAVDARGRAGVGAQKFAGRIPRKADMQHVASITTAAARGQLPADEVAVALKMVLSMEGIACQ